MKKTAGILLKIANEYNSIVDKKSDEAYVFKKAIDSIIRFISERQSKIQYSKKAQDLSLKKFGKNVWELKHAGNNKVGNAIVKTGKYIAYEHIYPVNCVIKDILNAKTDAKISKILDTKIEMAMITKDEDHTLNDKGYRTCRPANAYKKCGIKLKSYIKV